MNFGRKNSNLQKNCPEKNVFRKKSLAKYWFKILVKKAKKITPKEILFKTNFLKFCQQKLGQPKIKI